MAARGFNSQLFSLVHVSFMAGYVIFYTEFFNVNSLCLHEFAGCFFGCSSEFLWSKNLIRFLIFKSKNLFDVVLALPRYFQTILPEYGLNDFCSIE